MFLCFQTNIGPIVLSVNSFREIGNPLTLTSTQEVTCPELAKVVEEAVRLQNESGYPQTIIGEYTSKIENFRCMYYVVSGKPKCTCFEIWCLPNNSIANFYNVYGMLQFFKVKSFKIWFLVKDAFFYHFLNPCYFFQCLDIVVVAKRLHPCYYWDKFLR